MITQSSTWLGFGEWILNRRWWLVTLASLAVLLFEFFEYQPFQNGFEPRFFFEETFYGLFLPVSVGIALSALAASRTELAWSIYYQNLKYNLNQQLRNAHSHAELASTTLQFIKVVVPLTAAVLYKYDQDRHKFVSIHNWTLDKNIQVSDSLPECTAKNCPFLVGNEVRDDEMFLNPCLDVKPHESLIDFTSYCLPFSFSNKRVAGTRLYFSSENAPSQEHVRLLHEVASEISAAFHRVQLERLMKRNSDSVYAEQQRIARDVHDSLGHSLAYLSLRLSQISMESNQPEQNAVQQEVAALRDVAKDAYDQMRDVLNMLSRENNSNMGDKLVNYANRVSQQADFKLVIRNEGTPHDLSPLTQRNIFYIFQEALTNIEKHAHARCVNVNLKWGETDFLIEVHDDGVGFDPAIPIRGGHFGLNNIHERASESNAKFSIGAQIDGGVHILLRVPYEEVP